jgi:pseudouridine synthase
MNKPRGVVTTLRDPEGRRTVADLLKEAGFRQRLFPVGRLDFDAEGLLLVTNDGDTAHAVLHPSRGLPKLYRVKVRGQPDRKSLARLRGGLSIGKGERTRPARVEIARPGDNPWLEITLKEGRPNQIKRMLDRVGHRVLRLRRTAIGPLRLRGLRPGEVRPLRPEELARLRKALEGKKRRPPAGPLDATR